MNEFEIIKKYLRPLSTKSLGSYKLTDDIFFDSKKKFGISIDTYVEGVHFKESSDPNKFLKKVLRASLSDLYCKGLKPKIYFLSFALNKKFVNPLWLQKIKKILKSEQKKFNIILGGGDTTSSQKLVITSVVMGYSKNKPVLRNGSSVNDDIYVTGDIGDSFVGLSIINKKKNFGKFNNYFKKIYYEPILPFKIAPYLNKISSSSIDISDGLAQDLQHLCKESNVGAYIDLNLLPLSKKCTHLINSNKLKLKNIFSKGDDYQILFTSNKKNRSKISVLSKKLTTKISRIGVINKNKNIIFKYYNNKFKLKASIMGYKHIF